MLLTIIIAILICLFLIYTFIPSTLYKRYFKKVKQTKEKLLYLTFDDGPSEYTAELLDCLKENNVKATFFCVANFAAKFPNIIDRFKEEGHEIALHSLKHKNAMIQGPLETSIDLNKSLEIMNTYDTQIKFYRPPWGDLNLALVYKLKKKNIKLILWDVMAEDWEKNTTPEIIAKKILRRIRNGSIICLHDGRGNISNAPSRTIQALESVIPILLEKGYTFKTIDEY